MKRRGFAISVAAALFAGSLACLAQPPANTPRIAFLGVAPLSRMTTQIEALRAGLRELGYIEGKNIVIEFRSAEGRYERLRPLAEELVGLKVDLIVASGTPPSQAAKAATASIPIVMAGAGDPVATGLVSNLARPGGNLTGTSNISPPLVAKRLELLKEFDPNLRRVAVLVNRANPAQAASVRAVEAAALPLKLEVLRYGVQNLDEIRGAFSSMKADRVDALVVANDTVLIANAAAIAEMATKQRLPSAGNREFAEAGGLIGYGSVADVVRHSAVYVDKILRGAKPAGLPIEQPSKYEVFLNLRTAKAVGFAMPASFRIRVDRVIE
jgi:putative ABC transport system substrate-binding protein